MTKPFSSLAARRGEKSIATAATAITTRIGGRNHIGLIISRRGRFHPADDKLADHPISRLQWPSMHLLYSALLAVVVVLTTPWWLARMLAQGKYRAGLGERLGRVPTRLGAAQGCIWVHAVSVGEVLAVSGLVAGLRARFPARRVVVSTTTATGQKLARERFGENNVFYYPADFAFAIRPYLRALRPDLVVLAES